MKTFCKNDKKPSFIKKYKWEGINLPSENDDWRKFEKKYLTIAFNVFYSKYIYIYIYIYILLMFQNTNYEKEVIF